LRLQADRGDEAERAAVRARYGIMREQALEYRWYLEVQREALGIRSHALLDELYPVPGALE
jgi:hypothetical protein